MRRTARIVAAILAVGQSGCFAVGAVIGGFVADSRNGDAIIAYRKAVSAQASEADEAPALPIMTAENHARCEQQRASLAEIAAHTSDAQRQREIIASLPNCSNPDWDAPPAKPRSPLELREVPEPDLRSVPAWMVVGFGLGLLVDAAVVITVCSTSPCGPH